MKSTTTDVFEAAIQAAILAMLYCLPMIIAIRYRHRRRNAIAVLNIFFGWTVVGWVVALMWARRWRRSRRYTSPAVATRADP